MLFGLLTDLLWCAPEGLREGFYFGQGTQKGDVYSFAIILQECHTREGAWSGAYLEPQGTPCSLSTFIFFVVYEGSVPCR